MATTGLARMLSLVYLASVSQWTSWATTVLAGESAQLQKLTEQKQSGEKPGTDCYKGMCWCQNSTADCSGNLGNLTFIPKMNGDITVLKFSYNNLTEIPNEEFFWNVTDLFSLDLGHNYLRNLSRNSFRRLVNLKVLYLNYNRRLRLSEALAVFDIPTLVTLEFASARWEPLPEDFFANRTLPQLQTLDLSASVEFRKGQLDLGLFSPLSRLEKLWLSDNGIKSLGAKTNFASLIQLYLNRNRMTVFPKTCNNGTSVYPNLQELGLDGNRIQNISDEVCLPALRVLSLNSNGIGQVTTDMFSLGKFPHLEELYVENMRTRTWKMTIQDFAFRNTGLLILSLRNNKLSFENADVSEEAFSGCSGLKILDLSKNNFNQVNESRMKGLFQPLASLQNLTLSETRLASLTSEVLRGMPGLVKLELWKNTLSEIGNGTFDGLRNLTWLDLAENSLTGVSEEAFGAETRAQLHHLDLSGNPFSCSCSDLWFPLWLKTSPALFANSRFDYVCVNYDNINMTSFVDTYCNKTSTTPGTSSSSTTTTTSAPSSLSEPKAIVLYVLAVVVVVVAIAAAWYLLVRWPWRAPYWCWAPSRRQYQPISP